MKKIKLIAAGMLCLVITSCKKLFKDNNVYTLSGHVYVDCNMQPYANKEISLYQVIERSGLGGPGSGGQLAVTTTDANGYFKFDYKDDGGGEMQIRYKAGAGYNSIMEEIPRKLTEQDMVLYKNPTTNIQVSLNVVNAHTANDTLILPDYSTGKNLRIPCPLNSGIVYTANNYVLPAMYYNGQYKQLTWMFTSNIPMHYTESFRTDKYCNNTIYVTCDIN